ncbi:MAG: putative metal-binding motif-containing protein [Polyangiaceae bacterium]
MRSSLPSSSFRFAVAFTIGLPATSGCGTFEATDRLIRGDGGDASVDATRDGAVDGSSDATRDVGAADGATGAPCVDDAQCDDGVACTYDACDTAAGRCRIVPDDAQCDDGKYCNGVEKCVAGRGCAPGPVVSCDDADTCTIDRCIEEDRSCEHAPRDADGDGDPDDRCVPSADCDDLDPRVSSRLREVCSNGKDDDCDGMVDEADCASPVGDTCAAPVPWPGSGNYRMDTAAARRDVTTSCPLSNETTARDVVAKFTVPAGAPRDVDVWSSGSPPVALAIQGICGSTSGDLACSAYGALFNTRVRARNLGPGDYYAVVGVARESTVDLKFELRDPEPKATNETCGSAMPIATDVEIPVSIIDAAKDLESRCPSVTGELTYSVTLTTPKDLRIDSRTVRGQGTPVVSFRSSACSGPADELRCKSFTNSASTLLVRSVQPGTYVVAVSATAPSDVALVVASAPPTSPLPDESCATAPGITTNTDVTVNLRDHGESVGDGCFPGAPSAALALPLGFASDVLLVGRFAQLGGGGALSLGPPTCTSVDRLACVGGNTPVRLSKRNVPAGQYRVGVFDSLGNQVVLTPLVRPTRPPTSVGPSDGCADAFEIPATGGYFTGDTSMATAETNPPCDGQNNPLGGAPEQVMHLRLPARSRVVFDMEGSSFITVLDVRRGPACPGAPVTDGCYVGFASNRSFLDLTLDAGDTWIVVDGFGGAKGPWNLDVRVLPL